MRLGVGLAGGNVQMVCSGNFHGNSENLHSSKEFRSLEKSCGHCGDTIQHVKQEFQKHSQVVCGVGDGRRGGW